MSITDGEIDPLLTTKEVADLFSVKPETVSDWIKQGKIPGVKINGYWRIKRSDMVAYARKNYG